ncbi:hypothetical protein NC653_010012 [Populus alba x Populus x berolinensis]|uniref:Beta-adaptin appendage C-terminal subdomain domain-containing protein n=1 Tax=Populus alba x Populus x berolinensis TaxID=444605 RepID=A0AAD6RBL7_9ROSI|nr:hypothetical protein NC653_010012 [Populus alba x Populus x berolinensis]
MNFLCSYESIIATLCESLDTLDEPEAKASMIWIIGEYAERIDNADELLESFLESFPEEPAQVQLQLLDCKLNVFESILTSGILLQVVLNNATMETDNPDLRDRAYIYWRLLSTDPEAAKDVVLAEKPVISDDSNQLDPSLLDELLANISTLSSVVKQGILNQSAHTADGAASPPTSASNVPYAGARQPAPAPSTSPPAAPLPDLMGDLLDMDNYLPLPVLLPAATGQGLQISAQLTSRDAAGPLQVPQLQPGTSAATLLPVALFQNMSAGPPSSLLQVAVKNNQQPVWYFNDKISLHVFFTEDGRMERGSFLETWRSLPDSNEVSKDFPDITVNGVEATLDRLAASNMFFIAKRKHANQDVFYFSAKMPRGIPFLTELTTVVGIPGIKCAIKTPNPEMANLFFEAIETLLKG